MDAHNIELAGIDTRDAPDFCDAHVVYAEHADGTPYTDDELDTLNDDADFVYNAVLSHIY